MIRKLTKNLKIKRKKLFKFKNKIKIVSPPTKEPKIILLNFIFLLRSKETVIRIKKSSHTFIKKTKSR